MNPSKLLGLARCLPALGLLALLSGCSKLIVLDPKGQVGLAQRELLYICVGLMLLVVIPVIIATLVFAWKYRESNTEAEYLPNWAHSTKIEAFVWGIPIAIILVLGTLTWFSSHSLDPFKPLQSQREPIRVQVVAMDWKWLFIYPDEGVASINELAFPVDTPVSFDITSDTVMNTFFIPQLGSMIYAMSGMQSKLHLDAHEVGDYLGLSGNYSGNGFAKMSFTAKAMTDADYQAWLAKAKAAPLPLTDEQYRDLSQQRNLERADVTYFSAVAPDLFGRVIRKYMPPTANSREPALAMSAGE